MRAARYLTLVWPGLPWLWLRGSIMGLLLALAFAVVLDVAVITTWIWSGLVELQVAIGIWTVAAAIFAVGTASAARAFPPPLHLERNAATDALFVKARDAYLARDWTTAEAALGRLLTESPTDGEAQMLLGTLLRRVGRLAEARTAFEKLSAADSGRGWRTAIERELVRIGELERGADTGNESVALPLSAARPAAGSRSAAA